MAGKNTILKAQAQYVVQAAKGEKGQSEADKAHLLLVKIAVITGMSTSQVEDAIKAMARGW